MYLFNAYRYGITLYFGIIIKEFSLLLMHHYGLIQFLLLIKMSKINVNDINCLNIQTLMIV